MNAAATAPLTCAKAYLPDRLHETLAKPMDNEGKHIFSSSPEEEDLENLTTKNGKLMKPAISKLS